MAQTREAHRAYMRDRRAAERRDKVTPIDKRKKAAGSKRKAAESSVLEALEVELASLPLAVRRPVDAEAARALARIIDDPAAVGRTQAVARLREIMTDLRAGADSGKGKLAQLRASRPTG